MAEEWRTINGFPGYEISSLGNVRSWGDRHGGRAPKPRQLRLNVCRGPYMAVSLYSQKRRGMLTHSVHRLVLEAFGGPAPGIEYQAGHLDGNHTNNRADNLAWVTAKENAAHRFAHGRQPTGEKSNLAKLTTEKVRAIRDLWGTGRYSKIALSRIFGCSRFAILEIVRGDTWRATA